MLSCPIYSYTIFSYVMITNIIVNIEFFGYIITYKLYPWCTYIQLCNHRQHTKSHLPSLPMCNCTINRPHPLPLPFVHLAQTFQSSSQAAVLYVPIMMDWIMLCNQVGSIRKVHEFVSTLWRSGSGTKRFFIFDKIFTLFPSLTFGKERS